VLSLPHRRKARHLTRPRKEFLKNRNHEIRCPLMFIQGQAWMRSRRSSIPPTVTRTLEFFILYIHVLVVICINVCSIRVSKHPGPHLDPIRIVVDMGHERVTSSFRGRNTMFLLTSLHSRIIPPIGNLGIGINSVKVNGHGTFGVYRVVAKFAIIGGLVV